MDSLYRLSAAIDGVVADELESADLPTRLRALHRAAARLHAELLRTTAEFDARGDWKADGAVSAAAWVRHAVRVSDGAAREQVRTGRLLRDLLPETAAALASGDVGVEHVRVIGRAATAHPALVEAARRLGPRALTAVVARWADAVDPGAGLADAECAYSARRLSLSPTLGGMVAVDGLLDPESGTTLITAVQALAGAGRAGSDDDRTPAQRRADALIELARVALDAGGLPASAGERPHLLVTVDATALVTASGSAALSGAVRDMPIPGVTAARLSCDALVTPLWVEGGVPVDVGRTTRLVSSRLRRLLAARDGGCRFPGCDRPLAWCDAHHVIPWSIGGGTDQSNLVMLCRRHHRAVHEGGFRLVLAPDRTVCVWRPDGTPLALRERPPPGSAAG
jgi:hypothetical protein